MIERASAPPAAGPGSPARSSRWPDLWPRALSGVVMIAVALGTARVGGLPFAVFWLLAACAVVWEWQHLVGGAGTGLRFGIGVVAVVVAVSLVVAGRPGSGVAAVAAGSLASAFAAPTGARAAAAFGPVYAGALGIAVTLLRRSSPAGLDAILWLFAVVWGTDVMAYFGGRLIGGPKLWPRMSPSKTWSGFLVGVASGALAGLAVAPPATASVVCLIIGLFAGILAQGGDLFESSVKRRSGVKDASHLIPGHGGVMDRLDGFIAAAVFAACLGVARAGVDAAGLGLFAW